MSYCSDVMKLNEASSCCTPQDTTAHAAQALRACGWGYSTPQAGRRRHRMRRVLRNIG